MVYVVVMLEKESALKYLKPLNILNCASKVVQELLEGFSKKKQTKEKTKADLLYGTLH